MLESSSPLSGSPSAQALSPFDTFAISDVDMMSCCEAVTGPVTDPDNEIHNETHNCTTDDVPVAVSEPEAQADVCIPVVSEIATTEETLTEPEEVTASEDVAEVKSRKQLRKERRAAEHAAAVAAGLYPPPTPAAEPASLPTQSVEVAATGDTSASEDVVIESENEDSGGPKFTDLPLSREVLQAVLEAGYERPTDIQAQIIPHVLDGRDVLAQSQTGTGKTAAFALPILSKITANTGRPQVLVLAPTRELAVQVADSFAKYGRYVPHFEVAAVYGGQGYDTQLRQLRRGVAVVVGTPGRVIDHINRGTLDLSGISCLVLDEADEMLNMGFLEDVQFVLQHAPAERQVALFSATLPGPIREIAQEYLNEPARITIKQNTMTAEAIRQRAVFVPPREKINVLARFLQVEQTDGVIVFTKTREASVTVAEQLVQEGFSAVALNGDMAQNVRERTIDQLKSGRLDVLVATDVAARGLDVSRISHVINFDLPQNTESYIHRIGRTGRAGRNGEAIIFLTNAQKGRLRLIERTTKQPIEIVQPPTAAAVNEVRVRQFKEQIAEASKSPELDLLQTIVTEYAAESEQPMELVAAALAHLSQQGRSLLVKEAPRRRFEERPERHERSDRSDRGSRDQFRSETSFDRNDRRRPERGERFADDRPRTRPRRGGPPESGMDRYRIEVGHADGVKPGNIVGAIANEGGIDGEFIGPINIFDDFSTIDLPEGMPRDVFETLQQIRIAGKPIRLSRSNGREMGERPARDNRPRRNNTDFKPRPGKRPGKFGPPGAGAARRKKRREG
ncbi:MAG: DEAD/DEAH box helicase [Planctomycetaceae bacterium]